VKLTSRLTRSHIRWPLILVAAATGLGAYATYLKRPDLSSRPSANSASITLPAAREFAPQKKIVARSSERPLYIRAIREDMFSGPKPLDPRSAPPPGQAAPRVFVSPPNDPTSDAVYAGSMTVHGQTFALIESRTTREGTYIAAGDAWQNIPVVDVTPRAITFEVNGIDRTLPVSDTINVVQLSSSAPGMVSSPADQAKLDKKAAKAAARAEKKLRAAIKKAEKRRQKQEKKALQAIEEDLANSGNL